MLLLATSSDLVQIVTSSTADLDVHASWVDVTTTTVTPGRTNTQINSIATTTVVGSPAPSTYRTVKSLHARNKHAATAQDVTVQHYSSDGAITSQLVKVTLSAGDALHYDEHTGFTVRDNLGRIKRRADTLMPASSPSYTTVVLGSDVANAEAVANTITDVTGLSFAVVSGNTYWFRFYIVYTSAATGTGSRWSINGPTITTLVYRSEYSLTTTSRTLNEGLATYDVPAASNATSATTGANSAIIEGVYKCGANGTVIARFASEVTVSAITAKAGSICHWQQII